MRNIKFLSAPPKPAADEIVLSPDGGLVPLKSLFFAEACDEEARTVTFAFREGTKDYGVYLGSVERALTRPEIVVDEDGCYVLIFHKREEEEKSDEDAPLCDYCGKHHF